MSKEFHNQQTEITAAKIKIYKEYIDGYFPKILQTFKRCLIADLFCGSGKNGNEKGSSLALIEQAESILTSPQLKGKSLKIDILFNDSDRSNIDKLKSNLEPFAHNDISVSLKNQKFKNILKESLESLQTDRSPKFFFLDPFTYSDVSIDDLKSLMNLKNVEVFFFIPVSHAYRFAKQQHYRKEHKTRRFVESFTTKGIYDYKNIDDFMDSIKQKLKDELSLKYVRPILLDAGKSKNGLFLLTKHQAGMLLMNKIMFRQSDDGARVSIKQQQSGQANLFGTQGTLKYNLFANKLQEELKNKNTMSNEEIVDFTIRECFLPKHAMEALKNILEHITVKDNDNSNITNKPNKWNIAEKITKKTSFTYGN